MEEIKNIEAKASIVKVWLYELASIVGLGTSYTLHEVNEALQTVAIIVTIIGGVAAIWNSFRKKQ